MSSRSLISKAVHAEGQGPSVPELLGKLATDSSRLIRDEIALAKQEMSEKVVVLRSALVWAVVSASLGLAALLALCGAAAAALAPVIGAWQALLVIGGCLMLISVVVAYVSVGILKRLNLTPEETLDTLEENREWLKEMT